MADWPHRRNGRGQDLLWLTMSESVHPDREGGAEELTRWQECVLEAVQAVGEGAENVPHSRAVEASPMPGYPLWSVGSNLPELPERLRNQAISWRSRAPIMSPSMGTFSIQAISPVPCKSNLNFTLMHHGV